MDDYFGLKEYIDELQKLVQYGDIQITETPPPEMLERGNLAEVRSMRSTFSVSYKVWREIYVRSKYFPYEICKTWESLEGSKEGYLMDVLLVHAIEDIKKFKNYDDLVYVEDSNGISE